MTDAVTPFRIAMPDAALDELRAAIGRTRWPDQVEDAGWDYGTELGYRPGAGGLLGRRASTGARREQVLNSVPQYRTEVDAPGFERLRPALRAPAGRGTCAAAARAHPRLAEHALRVPRRRRPAREPGRVRRRPRRRVPRRRAVAPGVRLLRHPASTRHDAARDGDDVRRADARARLRAASRPPGATGART